MTEAREDEITALLIAWSRGDASGLDRLMELVAIGMVAWFRRRGWF